MIDIISTPPPVQPLRVGIIGMGGFAGAHHEAIWQLEQAGECRLVCACDPQMATFTDRQNALNFSARGLQTFRDYREMLATCGGTLDLLTVPTPIPLHAPMHQAGVDEGLAVYLEKPPTLNWAELTAMLAVEAKASINTNVGFNFLVEPTRQALKRRLVAGEFGAVRQVSVLGLWPRSSTYYERAAWAGRLLLDNQLVLDSPMGNAMAHHVHDALHWAGVDAPWAWGELAALDSELYRAHPIQGADTIFVRGQLTNGIALTLALSHACVGSPITQERVECERATITYDTTPADGMHFRLTWANGQEEKAPHGVTHHVTENFRAYCRYIRGECARPLTRLIDSRPFVHLNNLAYLAAGRITSVDTAAVEEVTHDALGTFRAIHNLPAICQAFLSTGAFPSEQGIPWARPGGQATPAALPRLQEAVERIANGA
jgi:predicted dehydrogenase